jgi:hypothetical protein
MKKTALIFTCLMSLVACSYAQEYQMGKKEPTPRELYAETINEKDLERHLRVIAADSMEGRDTGSEGMRKAGKYIANHFKSLGLLPPVKVGKEMSYLQEYKMVKRQWKASTALQIGKETFVFGKDFYPIRYPQDKKVELSAEVLIAPNEDVTALEKLDLKGKAIIFLEKKLELNKKIAARAKELGAAAVLVVKSPTEDGFKKAMASNEYYFAGRQTTFVSAKDEAIYYISPTLASKLLKNDKIANALQKVGEKAGKIKIKGEYTENVDLVAQNVLGFLEGTDKKDEIVVITAHYDHVGMQDGKIHNGADDDGSGTVSVMEIAEAFAKAASEGGTRPRRSILFMTVSGEEKGLFGSQFYTDFDPIFPLSKTVVNLNIDMVGRLGGDYIAKNEPNYIYLIGSDKLSTELHKLSEETNKNTENLILDYKYNSDSDPNRFYYRSDHYNFAKNDVPIIFYFNGVHEDYHKPTDDVDKIHFPKMAKIARLVFHTAWEIANRDNRLVVDKK